MIYIDEFCTNLLFDFFLGENILRIDWKQF